MNIYENFIQDTGVKKATLNTKEVLERFKAHLKRIEKSVTNSYMQARAMEDNLASSGMYTANYIDEYLTKMKVEMERKTEVLFKDISESMDDNLKFLKEKTISARGDDEISKINMLKLQSILSKLSIEDKEEIFENSKGKDLNVLEVLYLDTKVNDEVTASRMLDYITTFSGQEQVKLVENEIAQIKSLKNYLGYDYIKMLDSSYQAQTFSQGDLGVAISKTINAYVEEIDSLVKRI